MHSLENRTSTMPPADEPSRARKPARVKRGPRILAALMMGANVDEIAGTERLSRKRVEILLRKELQRRWVAPARDYARLQIARLEKTSANLLAKAEAGDLPSLDRLLRIMDRLDRYHGFSRQTPPITDEYAGMRERLMAKINAAAARLQPPPEGSP
jgi:hypothetical protein